VYRSYKTIRRHLDLKPWIPLESPRCVFLSRHPLVDPSSIQVEQVVFAKSGSVSKGTVHLTAHHIIFRYDDTGEKEMWVSVSARKA
jgi:glucokinase